MKRGKLFFLLLAVVCLLAACRTRESAAEVPDAGRSSGTGDSISEERSHVVNDETLALFPGLPHLSGTEYTWNRDIYIYLLEQGVDSDNLLTQEPPKVQQGPWDSDVWRITAAYARSPFAGIPVKVLQWEVVDQVYGVLYRLSIEVPKDAGRLRAGRDTWYVRINSSGDFSSPVPIVHQSAYTALLNNDGRHAYLINQQQSMVTGFETFASPADIPEDSRLAYILVNAPPSYMNAEDYPYFTQADINKWAGVFFGLDELVDREHFLYEQDPERGDVYTLYKGWGPPRYDWAFVHHRQDKTGDYYYYDCSLVDIMGYGNISGTAIRRVLKYTVRDDMVYACEDVTDRLDLDNPYLYEDFPAV